MTLEQNKLSQVKGFFGGLLSRIKQKAVTDVDTFYSIVIGNDHEEQCRSLLCHEKSQCSQQQQLTQHQAQPICSQSSKQHQQQQNHQIISIISQQSKANPSPHFHTRKLNPRHQKFIRIQKSIQPPTQPNQHEPPQSLDEDKRRKEQLKAMNRRRLELREKLRRLNEQLERERQKNSRVLGNSSVGHGEAQVAGENPEEELNRSKNSSFLTQLHHKSQLQLVPRKKKSPSLAEKEKVYSQEKHTAAFKLIQKLHAERLRKQQKMLNQMKNKQQRELQAVQRLQQERYRQRQEKLDRQKIYYTNTPKSRFSSKTRFINAQNKSTLQNPLSNKRPPQLYPQENPRKHNQSQLLPTETKQFFNQPKISQHDLVEQEIALIIPRQKEQSNVKKGQFLYTEEEFQPQTQQGKEFRQCLQKEQTREQGQSVSLKVQGNKNEEDKVRQSYLKQQKVRQTQIIESNIKSQQDVQSMQFSETKQLQLKQEITENQFI